MKSTFFKQVLVAVLGVLFVTGVSNVLAGTFREPQALPPWNADAPVNTSGAGQTKAGGLTVGAGNTTATLPMFSVGVGRAGFNTNGDTTLNATVDIRGSIYTVGGSRTKLADAQRIIGYLNGGSLFTEANYADYDVDGNGVVSLEDALIALNMSASFTREEAEQIVYGQMAEPESNILGDLNSDRQVTATDAAWVDHIVAGSANRYSIGPWTYHRADVNGDGTVTSADSTQIRNWAVGITDNAPCAPTQRGKLGVIAFAGSTNDVVVACLKTGGSTVWQVIN